MSLVFVLGTMASMGLSLTMRLYQPMPAILDGIWTPPPVRRVG